MLPALAVAALIPAVWQSSYRAQALWHPDRVAFFSQGLYKSCIQPHETVAVFPFGFNGDSLLYQAEANFRFKMAGDGLGPVNEGQKSWTTFDADWVVLALYSSDPGRPSVNSLLAFAALHHVDRVISLATGGYPSAAQMASFGPTERIGGVLVAPACGQPSLAKRDLSSFVARYQAQRASQANIDYCLGSNLDTLPAGLDPSGVLQGATPALFVSGQGLTCAAPPAGYAHHGFATPDLGVPADTYPLYSAG